MGEVWVAAAVTVGGAAISGYASSRAKKKEGKEAQKMSKEEARTATKLGQFERDEDYYFEQLEKGERMRGLDEFRKFNTVRQFAPNYAQDADAAPVMPSRPDIGTYLPLDAPKVSTKKKKSGFGKLLSKVDPLGSKLVEIDPLSNSVING